MVKKTIFEDASLDPFSGLHFTDSDLHFDLDPDPLGTSHFDRDLDPTFHFDPDPAFFMRIQFYGPSTS
jgi:hypothetical protein